jgi:hypothetical protein
MVFTHDGAFSLTTAVMLALPKADSPVYSFASSPVAWDPVPPETILVIRLVVSVPLFLVSSPVIVLVLQSSWLFEPSVVVNLLAPTCVPVILLPTARTTPSSVRTGEPEATARQRQHRDDDHGPRRTPLAF